MTENSTFKIDSKPICLWDFNLRKNNKDFLNEFDSDYFLFQTELFEKELDGENSYKAALSIKNVFHHSLETMFSLFCAAIQAPYCMYAWLNLSRTNDLKSVVKKISNNDKSLFHFLETNTVSWEKIAETVYFIKNDAMLKGADKTQLVHDMSSIWSALADLFINEFSKDEYNAIKHGLRTKTGGFSLNIGPPGTLNKPEKHNEWITLGTSKYGSSFFILDKVNDSQMKRNLNYKSKKRFLNWNPYYLIDAIKLITCSISNMISYLMVVHKHNPLEIKYMVADPNVIKKFWKFYNTRSNMSFEINTPDELITCATEEEINKSLENVLKD
jgi:hypothetical protein